MNKRVVDDDEINIFLVYFVNFSKDFQKKKGEEI